MLSEGTDQMQRGGSGAGVIAFAVVLAGLLWLGAILALDDFKMDYTDSAKHRDALEQIAYEMGIHRIAEDLILVPQVDSSLTIFVNRVAFESVPYPDREELAAAISDIWCNQVSFDLLPLVRFKDSQRGSTLLTNRCTFKPTPGMTGNYTGTVHNNTASIGSTFQAQLVSSDNRLKGCMQVDPPLFGTGPVSGKIEDRNFTLDLTSPAVSIRFYGTRAGHSITGHYTVTSNGQTGTFMLHQDIPRLDNGFDANNCPR